MEANGLCKCRMPSFCLGCGCTEGTEMIGAAAAGCASATAPIAIAKITPTCSNEGNPNDDHHDSCGSSFISCPNCQVARYCSDKCLQQGCCSIATSSGAHKSVCATVTQSKKIVRFIEEQISYSKQQHQQQAGGNRQSLESLYDQLLAEKVLLIDSLVIMAWQQYLSFVALHYGSATSFDKAGAAVRYIYEEALDHSIQVFCMSSSLSSASSNTYGVMNKKRLMILLLILDFDEYCEALFQYQLIHEHILSERLSSNGGTSGTDTARGMEIAFDDDHHPEAASTVLESNDETGLFMGNTKASENYLQQIYNLWKSGRLERFGVIPNEQEEHFAKIHAAGLCLVLFRKLESEAVDPQGRGGPDPVGYGPRGIADVNTMARQFRYLFDEYLPRQLTTPSLNNIIATTCGNVLFHNGTPTVYWSLLADSYRKEWGQYFDYDEGKRGIVPDDEDEDMMNEYDFEYEDEDDV